MTVGHDRVVRLVKHFNILRPGMTKDSLQTVSGGAGKPFFAQMKDELTGTQEPAYIHLRR